MFAVFMLVGLAATFLVQEPNQRSLEDMSNEDQDNFITGLHILAIRFNDATDLYSSGLARQQQ